MSSNIPKEVKVRIYKESIFKYPITKYKKNLLVRGAKIVAYRAGATAEAERAYLVVKALELMQGTLSKVYGALKETDGFGLIEHEFSSVYHHAVDVSGNALNVYLSQPKSTDQ